MCCFLIIYSIPVCLVGSSILFVGWTVPNTCYLWTQITQRYFETISMMATWLFYVAMLLVAPLGIVVVLGVTNVLGAIIIGLFLPPYRYLKSGYRSGLYAGKSINRHGLI